MHYLFALSMLILTALVGCAENPVTGKKQFSLMSASQEVAIGEQNYGPSQQQQGGRYSVDPELSLYVASVGKKLAAVSDRKELPYEFVVLNNDVPNAWALPGGKIAINRGLLLLLDDEAQLAAVLGHEIVHAAARHGATQMTQQAILGLGVQVAGVAAQATEYGELINMSAGLGASAAQAKYGRSQELESDNYGIQYMVRAGYEPYGAVELQETFVTLSEGTSSDFLSTLMASHPPSQERVDKNREAAEKLPRGVRNKTQYQQAIAQIVKDKAAYDANSKAITAIVNKDYAGAQSLINQAISKQPEEALFYVTQGQLQLAQNNTASAMQSFSTATRKNPDYFMGFLGLGLSQKSEGKLTDARSSLQKSLAILSTPTGAYHLGELELASGNRDAAITHFQTAQAGGGELGDAAAAQLSKLQTVTPSE